MQNPSALRLLKWLIILAAVIICIYIARPAGVAFSVFVGVLLFGWLSSLEKFARERFIRHRPLPVFLKVKLRAMRSELAAKDTDLIERGLKQFFIANLNSRGKFVAMPSKIADEMWHEFILHTKAYETWCRQAYGQLLHHTPAIALSRNSERNDGLRRAWYWACKDEGIDPRNPTRLPLLFALDKKLGIAGGFQYVPDCSDIAKKSDDGSANGVTYCGTSFSDGSVSGDADGFGGANAGGDGAGDSGGGDGGGCGGGD